MHSLLHAGQVRCGANSCCPPALASRRPAARRVRYLQRVLDASFNVLFDGRRRTTHSLIYNYFLVGWAGRG